MPYNLKWRGKKADHRAGAAHEKETRLTLSSMGRGKKYEIYIRYKLIPDNAPGRKELGGTSFSACAKNTLPFKEFYFSYIFHQVIFTLTLPPHGRGSNPSRL